MSVIDKLYSRISNNCLLKYLELNDKLHEGPGGFRIDRPCIDNVFFFNELMHGCIREDKLTRAFFLMFRSL